MFPQYRVRPYPDPSREAETEYMSTKEIKAEATKESLKYVNINFFVGLNVN